MRATIKAEPEAVALDLARTALIIIDMQRDFLEPGGFGERSATTSRCSAARSRRAGPCSRPRAPPASW